MELSSRSSAPDCSSKPPDGLAAFVLASGLGLGDASPPDWAAGILLGVGGAAGALLGVRIQPYVPVAALKLLLGLAAISAGARMVI